VSTGRDARVTEAGRYRFFAGWRSDPFFFDTRGALNDLQFTGDDFFIDKDVCSIVLEIPNSALGPKRVGLWARSLPKDLGSILDCALGVTSGRPSEIRSRGPMSLVAIFFQ